MQELDKRAKSSVAAVGAGDHTAPLKEMIREDIDEARVAGEEVVGPRLMEKAGTGLGSTLPTDNLPSKPGSSAGLSPVVLVAVGGADSEPEKRDSSDKSPPSVRAVAPVAGAQSDRKPPL